MLRQPGVASAEFIFEQAPFPSCHASTIVETPTGLVAAWFGGTRERNPDVGIWLSRQEDGKWSTPVEVANGVQSPTLRYPTWNPVLFQSKIGPLLLFYKVGPRPADWWGMLMTSDDGGRTWSKPQRLPDGILGPIKNKPVAARQRRHPRRLQHRESRDGWRVHFERSDRRRQDLDRAPSPSTTATRSPPSSPASCSTRTAACRPSAARATAACFRNLVRRRRQNLGRDDAHRTPQPQLRHRRRHARRRPATARLQPHRREGRDRQARGPLNVAVSDDGKNWNAALVLENEPTANISYPAVIQTADGLVHITYTWKRSRIKHVVIDPTKLKLTSRSVDGKWPRRPLNRFRDSGHVNDPTVSRMLPFTADLIVLVVYLTAVVGLGLWFAGRSRDTEEFMAAGRSLPGWAIGLSMFGSYISSISFLANPGKAYAGNWNAFVFSLATPIAAAVAVRWFVPFYRAQRRNLGLRALGASLRPVGAHLRGRLLSASRRWRARARSSICWRWPSRR